MKKVLILDANSLLNRAFYGIRTPMSTKDGIPTGAVFGYINILKKHLDAIKPDFAIAAFDVHAPTFRHKMDAAYKATRKPMPEELRRQLPFLREATEAMGLAIVEKEGFEADDILGTLSRVAEESGMEANLITGDRDSYQLVSEKTTLYLCGTGKDEKITPEVIFEKFGLSPRQMIEVKALAGDSGDNIPGVRGIGEKTALKLIAERGDLDGVYADIATLPVGPSAKEKLTLGKDDAYRSRALGEICRSIPEMDSVEKYPYEGFAAEKLRPLLVKLEFLKLLRAFGLEEESTAAPMEESPLQGTIFDLPQAEKKEVVPCPAETVAERLFPLTFDENGFYLLQEDEPCLLTGDVETLLRESRPVVEDAKAYYHAVSRAFGKVCGFQVAFDLCLAAYVINSQNHSMTLSRLSLAYLKLPAPVDTESDPAARLTLIKELYPILKSAVDTDEAKALYYEIELPLAYVLSKMEILGFQVSAEDIRRYGEALKDAADKLQTEIWALAGEEFLISSPKQLGKILFEKLGLPAGKKTKTGYATDAETLGKIRFHSPIIDLILNYRAVTKLHSTYVVGLLNQVGEDGRIHTVFNQRLTATGRLSSAEPNLQNIPVRTELGREMRKFFTAKEKGYVLVDADYSQIELRLLAHVSGDEVMQKYFLEGGDIHTKTASEIFHVDISEVTPDMRKSAKAVNFGIVYGIGEYSLGQDLGVPMYVAKDYIAKYFSLFPAVKAYLENVKAEAKRDGFVTTLFGRKRFIPELRGPQKTLIAFGERVAMNAPIQGTAADIIKLAMVRVDERLEKEGLESRLILQIHDELILEAPESEAEYAEKILKEEMENTVRYAVPLTAEAGRGFTWFDAK